LFGIARTEQQKKLGLTFYPNVPDKNVTAVLHYYHLLSSHLLLVSANNLKDEVNIYVGKAPAYFTSAKAEC
jgi:hypothetical protein